MSAAHRFVGRAELEAFRQPGRDFHDRRNLPQRAMILADAI